MLQHVVNNSLRRLSHECWYSVEYIVSNLPNLSTAKLISRSSVYSRALAMGVTDCGCSVSVVYDRTLTERNGIEWNITGSMRLLRANHAIGSSHGRRSLMMWSVSMLPRRPRRSVPQFQTGRFTTECVRARVSTSRVVGGVRYAVWSGIWLYCWKRFRLLVSMLAFHVLSTCRIRALLSNDFFRVRQPHVSLRSC